MRARQTGFNRNFFAFSFFMVIRYNFQYNNNCFARFCVPIAHLISHRVHILHNLRLFHSVLFHFLCIFCAMNGEPIRVEHRAVLFPAQRRFQSSSSHRTAPRAHSPRCTNISHANLFSAIAFTSMHAVCFVAVVVVSSFIRSLFIHSKEKLFFSNDDFLFNFHFRCNEMVARVCECDVRVPEPAYRTRNAPRTESHCNGLRL